MESGDERTEEQVSEGLKSGILPSSIGTPVYMNHMIGIVLSKGQRFRIIVVGHSKQLFAILPRHF